MYLPKEKIRHINSVVHEGKVVVFGTDADSNVWYTIKQDGFEDSYLNKKATERTGWENWKLVEFPNEAVDDASVLEKEAAEYTYKNNTGQYLLRSLYQTQDKTAVAPVQLISSSGHIYLFRQSKNNTLLVDRFVLDGMTNNLSRKIEVRFKRSKQKYKPIEKMKLGQGGLKDVDSVDFRDTDNNFFYEPTTELSLINNLKDGWFSVVQTPTDEHDVYRWHFFAFNTQNLKVELTTLKSSAEGLFDVKNCTVMVPASDKDKTLIPRTIYGITRRAITLLDARSVELKVTNGLSATAYDLQQEQEIKSNNQATKSEMQLIKTSSRIMLVIPTDQGIASISFAISKFGTLAPINETPKPLIDIRSQKHEVSLPLNTLDSIVAFAQSSPNVKGTITGFSQGTADEDAQDLVKVTSEQAKSLESGDIIEITNSKSYDDVYRVVKVDDNNFTVSCDPLPQDLGGWEKQEPEGGLFFDGMIAAYEKLPDGKLKITADNHGLENGDEVFIKGTTDYNNTYPIRKIDDSHFVIERSWMQSEAVNIQLETQKRRGIIFDGIDDYVALPEMDIDFSQGFTVEAWVQYNSFKNFSRIIDLGNGQNQDNIIFCNSGSKSNLLLSVRIGSTDSSIQTPAILQTGHWQHLAATVDNQGKAVIYVNGIVVQTGVTQVPGFIRRTKNYIGKSNWSSDGYFDGQIADLRIWQVARTDSEIKNNMHLQVTGREIDLVGYWRLGGIAEDKQHTVLDFSVNAVDGLVYERSVLDFSANAFNGVVYGGAYVGGIKLDRMLRNGSLAVKFSNQELFAVTGRGVYTEEFEFKVNQGIGVTPPPAAKSLPVTQGLQLYLDGDSFQNENWTDKSGKMFHATFSPNTVMPTKFQVQNYNTKNFAVVRFSANSGMNIPDDLNVQIPFTIIIVDRYSGSVHKRTLQSRDKNWLLGKWNNNNACYMEGWLGSYVNPSTVGTFSISSVTLGPTPFYYLDGKLLASAGGMTAPGRLGIGMGGKYPEGSDADIACILVYNRVLSVVEREAVEAWLGDQYAIKVTATVPQPISAPPLAFDINNIDGIGKKIFQMSYWGKSSRSARDKIELSVTQDDFKDLGNGWYRASCQFTIPDGVAMLRNFEIKDIRGEWETLEIRKHSIHLLSDAISEQDFEESVLLNAVTDNRQDLVKQLHTLEQSEPIEILLLTERNKLNKDIAEFTRLNSLTPAQVKAEIDKLDVAISAQNALCARLPIEKDVQQAVYNAELVNPLNYEFHLSCNLNNTWYRLYDYPLKALSLTLRSSDGYLYGLADRNNIAGSTFRRNTDRYGKSRIQVLVVDGYKWMDISSVSGHLLRGAQPGSLCRVTKTGDCYHITMENKGEYCGFTLVEGSSGYTHTRNELFADRTVGDGCLINIISTGKISETGQIAASRNLLDAKIQLIATEKQNLADLNEKRLALNGIQAALDSMINRLLLINGKLKTVQESINVANSAYIKGLSALNDSNKKQTTAQSMPELKPAPTGFQKGLINRGALINFVKPVSRVNAIPSCEGNVQLSYFDNFGCMRLTNYDATAEHTNPYFEEWRPDGFKACVNFNNTHSAIKLKNALNPGANWTLEVWFYYPFQDNNLWYVLTSSEDNTQHIVIYNGKYLGIRINGLFFDSGLNPECLFTGWHHLAVVGSSLSGCTLFYIDGVRQAAIKTENLADIAIELDGTNDYIQLPEMNIDYASGFTLEAWVKFEGYQNNAKIVCFADASYHNTIFLGNDSTANSLIFTVTNNSISSKFSIDGVIPSGRWLHIAVSIDILGKAQLYINGQPIYRFDSQLPLSISRSVNFIGYDKIADNGVFDGLVKEIRLWKITRSAQDIQGFMGKSLSGSENGLAGYWVVEKGAVNDKTTGKHHGILSGDPQPITAASSLMINNIRSIGYVRDATPVPKLAVGASRLAIEFNSNSFVSIDSPNNPSSNITVSCWAKCNISMENCQVHLLSKNSAFELMIDKGKLSFSICRSPGSLTSVSNWPGIDTQWHHYAGVFGSGTLYLFIDGNCVATRIGVGNSINVSTNPICIGKDVTYPTKSFSGQIAEVCIWNKARSANEILADMTSTLTGTEAELFGYWSLRDGLANDFSPSKLTGTIIGTIKGVEFTGVKDPLTIETVSSSFDKLTELRVWNTALSDEEIAVNSKTLITGNEPELLAYYPMNEAGGSIINDMSSNASEPNEGSLADARWWACSACIGNPGHKIVKFDGTNDYLEAPYSATLNPAYFTVSCWAKILGGAGTNRTVICSGDATIPKGFIIIAADNDTWQFKIGNGSAWNTVTGTAIELNIWTHLAATYDGSKMELYINGEQSAEVSTTYTANASQALRIGAATGAAPQQFFMGHLSEMSLWKRVLSKDEIQNFRFKSLTGKESDLVSYWALNEIKPDVNAITVFDSAGSNHCIVTTAVIVDDNTLPIGGDSLVSAEYNSVILSPSGEKMGMMRRFLASPMLNGVKVLPEKRIENLDIIWVGNAQFAPTLLGYIEGAPPIPSENLTKQPDYNGATSVELSTSEDISYSFRRAKDSGKGSSFDLFAGAEMQGSVGLGFETTAMSLRAGVKGNLDTSNQASSESNISSSSSTKLADRLELRGTTEVQPNFPLLGNRFIPKNVGYALVISGLADVFITKLKRSGKMVGRDVRPVDGIPPDVNIITFMINPAYTMQGSLDGLTGSQATSRRFFKHVPQMRSQYGSLYPASYYRLKEAYNLKLKIDQEDKRRESFYYQFDVHQLDDSFLDQQIGSGFDALDTGITSGDASMDLAGQQQKDQAKADAKKAKEVADSQRSKQKLAITSKIDDINDAIGDVNKRAHAGSCLEAWQKRMEDIQIQSGKRNIVNTYVWDADGGLRTESQSFASTAEHCIGGAFTLNGGLGAEGSFGASVLKAEMTAMSTLSMTQTLSKTQSSSKGIELNVDLSGVEYMGITDHNDYPIMPGEKVDRYRFMSFYLENSIDHFNEFFNTVVDPEWLRTNSEESIALRQAKGKANKTWRVLHRVTYVERPALMGFGRDVRRFAADEEAEAAIRYFHTLSQELEAMSAKLDSLMTLESKVNDMKTKLDSLMGAGSNANESQAIVDNLTAMAIGFNDLKIKLDSLTSAENKVDLKGLEDKIKEIFKRKDVYLRDIDRVDDEEDMAYWLKNNGEQLEYMLSGMERIMFTIFKEFNHDNNGSMVCRIMDIQNKNNVQTLLASILNEIGFLKEKLVQIGSKIP